MQASILEPLSRWLCLTLAFLLGLSPAQGFVVCVEADGCVSIEVKAPQSVCGGCDQHEGDEEPGLTEEDGESDLACPCIDLPMPGAPEVVRVSSVEAGAYIAPSPELTIQRAPLGASAPRRPPTGEPLVADSLAHARGLVLLV